MSPSEAPLQQCNFYVIFYEKKNERIIYHGQNAREVQLARNKNIHLLHSTRKLQWRLTDMFFCGIFQPELPAKAPRRGRAGSAESLQTAER